MTVRVWLGQPYPLGQDLRLLCAEADPFNSQLSFKEASLQTDEPIDDAKSGKTDRPDVSVGVEIGSLE